MSDMDQGHKHDAGKLRYDLIPVLAEELLVRVLTHGAEKYGAGSWKRVQDARARYTAALMRHLAKWRAGEQVDPDSGLPHIAHVACNAMFLAELAQPTCHVNVSSAWELCHEDDCDEPAKGDECVG